MSDLPFSVACPTCRKTVIWNEDSPQRPFCSNRCRQVDLGAWAFEEYRIAGAPVSPEDLPDPLDGELEENDKLN